MFSKIIKRVERMTQIMGKDGKFIDITPPIFREKYGSRIVFCWEEGEPGTVSHTKWQLDVDNCLVRHRGTTQGCFWTDWESV